MPKPTSTWAERRGGRRALVDWANRALAWLDLEMVRKSSLDVPLEWSSAGAVPPEVASRLRYDNERLNELRALYRSLGVAATQHSAWTDEHFEREVDLKQFRADNAFVWQKRHMPNPNLTYLLTAYHMLSIDRLGLFPTLDEDGAFGATTFVFENDKRVSRDLIDSVIEINALDSLFGIGSGTGVRILDIGAGYGRLAHRLVEGLANVQEVYCADGVAQSTFVCEFYLQYRGVEQRAITVPLDRLDAVLSTNRVDIATNIHSFSECTLEAIAWWLDLLREHAVRHLFIAPNTDKDLVSSEDDLSRIDFEPEIRKRGYRLVERRPKYRDPALQQRGLFPTHYHVFELSSEQH